MTDPLPDLPAICHAGQFVEDYRRTTRRARAVVEQVFYGHTAG